MVSGNNNGEENIKALDMGLLPFWWNILDTHHREENNQEYHKPSKKTPTTINKPSKYEM